jgi:type I restriction enzyme R subunit
VSTVGQREILTQRHVVELFQQRLGYRYLGNWKGRPGNSNVEPELLRAWLARRGHDEKIVSRALRQLDQARALGGGRTLYQANRAVYGLLRYGVKVRPDVGEHHVGVWLVDWETPAANDFALAEEVTVAGQHVKRPDLVLYINGIALGVLELKRSIVAVAEGIRQNLDSQRKEFIRPFFSTVQLIMAGNDTEGLRYGVIDTPEKQYLRWQEPGDLPGGPLDRALEQLCRPERLLERVHDFVVFDAGTKKTCRQNQYFAVRAAQDHVRRRQGGVIWHTQGSGKSLTMVWLAKWIREHVTNARVLLITDRTELDEQIEKVFKGVDEDIRRAKSGADLLNLLNQPQPWLICSLVHKFESSEEGDVDAFIQDLRGHLPAGFQPKGECFVFVDECHRTHSGTLHEALRDVLPGAMLIGFTGTPLLKKDKRKSIEVFGPYIHTYKYDQAVRDGVVLDLRYEARDIDQVLTSQAKIDQWFDLKTRGLTDLAKAQLKQRWGTLQHVLSAQSRLERIVDDVLIDMETRDRLRSGHGNAILVSGSIYQACRVFEMFQRTELAGRCAIVTSYRPSSADTKGHESGEGQTEKLRQYEIYRRMLAAHFDEPEEAAAGKVERFEREVKQRFIHEPGQMKLLIVVDKLLTGFDAPPATYLYIDKTMRDHGLFQAICRVNRLDSEDKEYGYVVDYKDLFKSLAKSIHDYTGEAFDGFDAEDVAGLLKDRLAMARARFEELRESIRALCEPVAPPRDTLAYLRLFGAAEGDRGEALKEREPLRLALYKLVAGLLRAYADLANEMPEAGYTAAEAQAARAEVEHYEKVREEVKLASGDYVDMKMFEPAMRHLLDTYIRAEETQKLSAFDDLSLVELIVERGEGALAALPNGLRQSREAMAETIENNVRKVIIDEMAVNPKYYEKMSALLEALIQARRQEALGYQAYLARIVELTRKVCRPETQAAYPRAIDTPARRALFDNLGRDQKLAIQVDTAVREVKKADWRGHRVKEREVRQALARALGGADEAKVNAIFDLAVNQREY